MRTRRVYFDYAASTPVDPRVVRAMRPYFTERYGNPGSLHSFGQEAIAAVDKSRATVARLVGAEFREIIFTGSATEANNLALRGAVKASGLKRPRVIVSAIEHESVLETARDLEREGAELVLLPVDRRGVVQLKRLKAALDDRTILVSVMYANNEIGTIQPIKEIAEVIGAFKKRKFASKKSVSEAERAGFERTRESEAERQAGRAPRWGVRPPSFREANLSDDYPLLHTDAAQAFQFLNCNMSDLGVDLMTISGHKIYGPKGVGALCMRFPLISPLAPLMTGGKQEFGFRPGTENVPLIVGFAKAAELVHEKKKYHAERIKSLRDRFWHRFKRAHPDAEVNGALRSALPNILSIYLPGYEAQDALIKLDLAGVAVSSGSACKSRSSEPSYVVGTLGYSRKRARQSIRVSFGRPTAKKDVDRAIAAFLKLFP